MNAMTAKIGLQRRRSYTGTDSLDIYMRQIDRFKMMTREEEQVIGKRYIELKTKADREALINANLRFVVKVAHEFSGYGFRLLDLVQEGNVGLCIAVEKWDPERNLRFITYAVWWVRAQIQNYLLRYWSVVRIGTNTAQRKLFYRLRSTYAQIQKLGLDSADEAREVARILEVKEDEVIDMNMRLNRDVSADMPIGDEEASLPYVATFRDTRPLQDEQLSEKREAATLSDRVDMALMALKPKEHVIVARRYLHKDSDGVKLAHIGVELGLSRERVRQLEARALGKLRQSLADVTKAFDENAA